MIIWQFAPLFPPHIGGLERVAFEVSKRLAEWGNQVIVLSSNKAQKKGTSLRVIQKNLVHYSFDYISLPPGPISVKLFAIYNKIANHYGKPNIIHIHFPLGGFAELGLIISKLLKCPLVAHAHLEIIGHRIFKYLIPLYYLLDIRTILRNASHFICPDVGTLQKYLQKTMVKDIKYSIIPSGIDHQIFHPPPEGDDEWKKSKKIVFIGQIGPQKRLDRLINALILIYKKIDPKSDIELDIFGDGITRASLEQLVKKYSFTNKIKFYGSIPHEKVSQILRSNTYWYMVLTSEFEGFPVAMLESMSCRLPVLVSTDSVFKEVFASNVGYLGKNPHEIARSLIFYLSDEVSRESLASKSLIFSKKYDWDVSTKMILEIYSKIIKK